MRVTFWGTRGSLARPGPATVRYGGNTSCVEVRAPDGTLVVLDCGTGAHDLGRKLCASESPPIRGHLLVSHTHWDHIQGFPFFAPLFVPGNEWDVYAPEGVGQHLEATLAGQMEYAYFPVTLEQFGATIRCHGLAETTFDLGAVRVATRFLNHPGLALGYRLTAGGVTVVYSTDHEPHSQHQPEGAGPAGPRPVHPEDRRHVEFLKDADLVIHDAQYTLAEYPTRITWGHTPAELAVDFALAAGARRLALFHHDPLRDDQAVDRLLEICRRRAATAGGRLEVLAAAEGGVVDLPTVSGPAVGVVPEVGVAPGLPGGGPAPTVLVVDDDPAVVLLLESTLAEDGFRILSAADGDTALVRARAERPDVIVLDWSIPGPDGLAVCRALRADPDPRLRAVPVLLLTGYSSPAETAAAFAAGASDYVTKPFKPTHIRARVQTWLLRGRTGGGGP